MFKIHSLVGMLWVGLMVLAAGSVGSQEYPNKVIRIVTTAVGGGTDYLARIIAEGISDPLGQPVIIDNRPAGFTPGLVASRASPDGYTLLVCGTSHYVSTLLRKVPHYDPIKDFSPITWVSTEPAVLVVHPSVPANSVKELIAFAKAKPGVVDYVSSGVGSAGHLGAELFKSMTGVDIVHIVYKNTQQGVLDLLAGRVHMRFGSLGPVIQHAKAGKLRALAVTGVRPSALYPGLPTVAATLPGYEFTSGAFVFAPAKTPVPIIKRLNHEIVRLLNTPETKEKIFVSGQEIVGSSPQELAIYLKADIARAAKAIKVAGIEAE